MSTKKHTRDRSKIDDKISDFFTDFEVIVCLVDIWLLVDSKILHYLLSFWMASVKTSVARWMATMRFHCSSNIFPVVFQSWVQLLPSCG